MIIDLKGKTAVVTGGSGAIGSAMCEKYAESGAEIAVVDWNQSQGRAFAQSLKDRGASAEYYFGDITDQKCMQDVSEQIIKDFGKIDILVNNAGINVGSKNRKPIHQFGDDDWQKIVGTDLTGVYNCSKPIVAHMVERGYGRIINISSVVGQVPLRNQCAFAAAKAGVLNLTRAMAIELAPYGVLVNGICPGSVMFEGTRELFYSDKAAADRMLSHIPLGRPGKPEEIAGATVFLSSEEASYITGSILTIDGGWTCGFARDF